MLSIITDQGCGLSVAEFLVFLTFLTLLFKHLERVSHLQKHPEFKAKIKTKEIVRVSKVFSLFHT